MYEITCNACGKTFDAMQAADCNCLQPVRSFQCPHCNQCFCNAGKAYNDAFWRDAPKELWDRRRSRAAAAAKDENESPETIARPVVLFADDDSVGRAIARQVVRSLGYGVVVARDGEEAHRLTQTYKPVLVITDALMPKLDGRELAQRIKQETPATKVVVITGVYKDPRYKHEAYRTFQVDDYLSKPVNSDDLRAVIEKHVPR